MSHTKSIAHIFDQHTCERLHKWKTSLNANMDSELFTLYMSCTVHSSMLVTVL